MPDLGQVTVTGTYENFGAGGLGDLGTGFGGLNGTTASPADLNGVRVEARLDAHAAAQAARKGKASAGKPDSGDSEGGQSPQTNSPPSNSQQPAQPTAPLPSGPPESASPPGNPCGCGDNGQSAVDAWDNAQTRLNDAADAWARGDLSQYEQDMNLALQDLMQYYKFLGQPLNPSDYGWQNGQ